MGTVHIQYHILDCEVLHINAVVEKLEFLYSEQSSRPSCHLYLVLDRRPGKLSQDWLKVATDGEDRVVNTSLFIMKLSSSLGLLDVVRCCPYAKQHCKSLTAIVIASIHIEGDSSIKNLRHGQ